MELEAGEVPGAVPGAPPGKPRDRVVVAPRTADDAGTAGTAAGPGGRRGFGLYGQLPARYFASAGERKAAVLTPSSGLEDAATLRTASSTDSSAGFFGLGSGLGSLASSRGPGSGSFFPADTAVGPAGPAGTRRCLLDLDASSGECRDDVGLRGEHRDGPSPFATAGDFVGAAAAPPPLCSQRVASPIDDAAAEFYSGYGASDLGRSQSRAEFYGDDGRSGSLADAPLDAPADMARRRTFYDDMLDTASRLEFYRVSRSDHGPPSGRQKAPSFEPSFEEVWPRGYRDAEAPAGGRAAEDDDESVEGWSDALLAAATRWCCAPATALGGRGGGGGDGDPRRRGRDGFR